MKHTRTLLAGLFLAVVPALGAQRTVATELGIFGQFSKYDDFTGLKNGLGAGARFSLYLARNVGLEYEADVTKTESSRLGNLTAFNNRVDLIFYFPMGDKLRLLAGGGWTGTRYHSDTTLNQYDSGGNAVVGFKYCLSPNWATRGDVNADFKDPSDQTMAGERTRTYNFRFGFSRFLGGTARNSPCYVAPPKPAPAPVYVAPPEPVVAPAPVVVPAPAPVITPAPAVVTPPPAPQPRELLRLHGTDFAFDKFNLTAAAKDTLQKTAASLAMHPDANIEIQGHTDSWGSDAYNQALSERRANAVRDYLITLGIAGRRITTRGFGETQPVADNKTAAGRSENRRVVIIELP